MTIIFEPVDNYEMVNECGDCRVCDCGSADAGD